MILFFFFCLILLSFFLVVLFLSLSFKEQWSLLSSSSFECGFTPYNYSRWSFSIHYYLISLIFLFLDLELCVLMPYFLEMWGSDLLTDFLALFVSFLLLGLLFEWLEGKLAWQH